MVAHASLEVILPGYGGKIIVNFHWRVYVPEELMFCAEI